MVWLRVKSGIRWLVESIFLRERFRLPSVRNDGRDNCSGTGTGHEMSSRNMWVLHGTSVKTLTDVCMHDEPPAALELCPSVRANRKESDCRVGGGALARWPPSAAQTARTVFPYAAFTKIQRRRDAREGIKSIN